MLPKSPEKRVFHSIFPADTTRVIFEPGQVVSRTDTSKFIFQITYKLASWGIGNAWQLSGQSSEWARKHLGGVVGMRLIQELRGIACIQLELFPESKKSIACTRSFGKTVTSLSHLSEAVSSYTSKAAEKLRRQGSAVNIISVFAQTSHYLEETQQYGASTNITLPRASDDTGELIHYALVALKKIYKSGPEYKKAGVIFSGIVPADQVQSQLFETVDREKSKKLMETLDKVNAKMGANTVSYATTGIVKKGQCWEMLAHNRSPRYTTRLEELPIVKAK